MTRTGGDIKGGSRQRDDSQVDVGIPRIEAVLDETASAPVITDSEIERLLSTSLALQGSVSGNPKTAAVIVAGGSGSRFGEEGGKQLIEILGRPMLTWTAEAFDAVPDIGQIVIVCPRDKQEQFCKVAFDPYPFVTPVDIVDAGEIRQSSSYEGVFAADSRFELVAIHDGARPLVTPQLIMHAISVLKGTPEADGAIVGHPAIDTLKVVGSGSIVGTPDREMFWVAQTPQVFRASAIRQAHMRALSEGFVGTDDSSLVERIGGKVLLVEGPRDNIKLTMPEDKGPIEAALLARLKNFSS